VVTQGRGYGGLPATEDIGLEHSGQPRSLQRILTWGPGGERGKAEGCCRLSLGPWSPGGLERQGSASTPAPLFRMRATTSEALNTKPRTANVIGTQVANNCPLGTAMEAGHRRLFAVNC